MSIPLLKHFHRCVHFGSLKGESFPSSLRTLSRCQDARATWESTHSPAALARCVALVRGSAGPEPRWVGPRSEERRQRPVVREAARDGCASRAPVPATPFLWLRQTGLLPGGRASARPQHMRTFHPGLKPSTAPQLQSALITSPDQGLARVTRPCRGGP